MDKFLINNFILLEIDIIINYSNISINLSKLIILIRHMMMTKHKVDQLIFLNNM